MTEAGRPAATRFQSGRRLSCEDGIVTTEPPTGGTDGDETDADRETDADNVTDSTASGSDGVMHHRFPGRATDQQLIDAARDGDHGAFEELVRRTHTDLHNLARRLVTDPDDARDVVQDAYLRAYRSIRKFRGDSEFSTWMYRITANCAATHLGRRRRHRHDDLDEEVNVIDADPNNDPEARADAMLLRRHLDAAIDDLPPKLRAVVVLRDLYDFSHADIARELGITESAAKVRLHRARRRLRTQVFPLRTEFPDEEDQSRAV